MGEVAQTIQEIISVFATRIDETGLIKNFDAPYWNFYEWTDGNFGEGALGSRNERPLHYDLILNCVFVYVAEKWQQLCVAHNLRYQLVDFSMMRDAIQGIFFNKKENLFGSSTGNLSHYSQLGNSFALLIGLGNDITANKVKSNPELVAVSLSMSGFVYDFSTFLSDFLKTKILLNT